MTSLPCLQAFPEAPQGHLTVAVLAPFVSGHNTDSRGEVNQPDRAFRPILVLPPFTPRGEGVHTALGEELLIGLGYRYGVWNVL